MTVGQLVLVGALVLAWAVWFGGLVTIIIVTLSAQRTLEAPARVEFMRDFGNRVLPVGAAALVVALCAGFLLLLQRPWTVAGTVAVVLAVALVLLLVVGVVQARRMTALRRTAVAEPDTGSTTTDVRVGARRATTLRSAITVLTVAVFVAAVVAAG